jgi:hypothetical protein
MWDWVLNHGSPFLLRCMFAVTFAFGNGTRPGEDLADTCNARKLFKCIGDFIFTSDGLLATYLGDTKRRSKAWAVNLLQIVLDLFVCYWSE